jgi:hypothetical protein
MILDENFSLDQLDSSKRPFNLISTLINMLKLAVRPISLVDELNKA